MPISHRLTRLSLALLAIASTALAPSAFAGEADVVKVRAKDTPSGWRFAVTVRHKDKGWDHYANNWEVLTPEGDILATRVLGHPHVNEQPFTRSLSGIEIPEGLTEVIIRARDSVHGYGGQMMRVDLVTRKAKVVDAASEVFAAPEA